MKRFLTSLFARSAKPRTGRPSLTERHRTLLQVESLEERHMLSGTATFLKTDTSTLGDWKGVYGSQGYNIIGDTQKYPGYANVTAGHGDGSTLDAYKYVGSSSDRRALQKVNGSDRQLSTWMDWNIFTVNINVTDGQAHQVAVYAVDWDNQGRSERIDILNPATGATLDSQTLSNFTAGEYLVWSVTGQVQVKVTRLGGREAMISGLFFDSTSQSSSVIPAAPTGLQWTGTSGNDGTLTWSAVAGADGYHLQWSRDNSQWYLLKDMVGANATSQSVTNGVGFYFRVSAYNAAGETFSAAIFVQNNQVTAPAAPTQLTWTATSGNDGTLSWSNVTGADGYDIYYWNPNDAKWVFLYRAGANETSITITNGYGYSFSVGAFNAAGETFSDPFLAS